MEENTGWSSNGYSNVQKSPIYTTRSGLFLGSSFNAQASYGGLLSSTASSGTSAYDLHYGSSNVFPAGNDDRQLGYPVRCIA